MPQPPAYIRAFSFTDHSAANPTTPQPGNKLDQEFNRVKQSVDVLRTNLALIQRDDGALSNSSVGVEQLKAEVTAGLNAVSDWASSTAYATNAGVWVDGALYRCIVAHTSALDFATDLADGYWSLLLDVRSVIDVYANGVTPMPNVNITGGTITGITDLAVADGGTGASTAAGARANLGLVIGADVQAYDAGLASIAGLTTVANQMFYLTGTDTYATTGLTAFGRSLLDDADASAARTTLGLGTAATTNATAYATASQGAKADTALQPNTAVTVTTLTATTVSAALNGTLGATTPAAATVTTLTATGQASVGGSAGSESLRVVPVANAVNRWEVCGSPTTGANFLLTNGADTDTFNAYSLKGAGAHSFFTNSGADRQLRITHTANAVNFAQVTGAATGGAPTISAQGSDADIPFAIRAKGAAVLNLGDGLYVDQATSRVGIGTAAPTALLTVNGTAQVAALRGDGNLVLRTNSRTGAFYGIAGVPGAAGANFSITGNEAPFPGIATFWADRGVGGFVQFGTQINNADQRIMVRVNADNVQIAGAAGGEALRVNWAAGDVNRVEVSGAATTASPVIAAAGTDSNIDLALTPKGTGKVRFGTHTATADTAISGYIEVKDAGGTVRKLAVIA